MGNFTRPDGRAPDRLRPVRVRRDYLDFAEGSCLVEFGRTRVVCAASVEKGVPPWLEGRGQGWVTAEYSMLPRATHERTRREVSRGRPKGRTQEIQRLIGRSLRAVVDFEALGELAITVDCDVLVADGGTRTAAITGGFVALHDAVTRLEREGKVQRSPILDHVAAVSVGIVDGTTCLDLAYEEDVAAGVDMNVVMTGDGRFVEVQGTAEGDPFAKDELEELVELASEGIKELVRVQRAALEG